jgi:putative SOS response-associated peptidase YedK
MPVILSPDDIAAWLDVRDERADVMRLVRPCPDDWLDVVPVSSRVNKVENDDPDCWSLCAAGARAGEGDEA